MKTNSSNKLARISALLVIATGIVLLGAGCADPYYAGPGYRPGYYATGYRPYSPYAYGAYGSPYARPYGYGGYGGYGYGGYGNGYSPYGYNGYPGYGNGASVTISTGGGGYYRDRDGRRHYRRHRPTASPTPAIR